VDGRELTPVAERQALGDAIHIGRMHRGGASEGATAFGEFGFRQMPFSGARAQDFSAGSDLKSLGHGLFGLNAFGTSHKSAFSKKSAQYRKPMAPAQVLFRAMTV
jgi:hypothetical protein